MFRPRQLPTAGDVYFPPQSGIRRVFLVLFETKIRFASALIGLGLILAGLYHLQHFHQQVTHNMEHPQYHRSLNQ